MKHRILRIAALTSSIALAGIYVGCRAVRQQDAAAVQPTGQAVEQPSTPSVMPGSKSMRIDPDPAFFSGSKSAAPLIPPATKQQQLRQP